MRPLPACLATFPLLLALTACKPAQDAPPPSADMSAEGEAAADATPPPIPETAAARFRCGDLLVGATFDNTAGHVTLSLGTRQMQLPQAVAASGARYADDQGNEFWNKGDDATLTLDGTTHDCTVTDQASPWDEARSRDVVFRGLGTEPFWSLEVDGGPAPQMRLGLDMGERKLLVPQVAVLDAAEGYAGKADDGSDVVLRITRGDCSDGMSDQTYPAGIELQVGEQTYRGCGAFLQE